MISSIDRFYPQRIVCLTEESTEWLYLLGESKRIVGISGFTRRPKIARKEKPIVSTFLDAQTQDILDLKPDLVIGFSDIQANIAKELIAQGVNVWISNHRSIEETLSYLFQLAIWVGKQEKALEWIEDFYTLKAKLENKTSNWARKPKVYFEEWFDPLISGINWVSELIHIAGGEDIFQELGKASLAKDRIIANPDAVVERNPDIMLASWCGKMFKPNKVLKRPNWENISAIKNQSYFDIPSEIILQPGPASLKDGLLIMHNIFEAWIVQKSMET